MRRSLFTRAAILMLALSMPLTAIRGVAASCCVDDCDQPCCERDARNRTVLPVLPCCRTVAADQVSTQSTPTTCENDRAPFAASSVVVTPLGAVALQTSVSTRVARLIPAPPLYHQHCALLL
jgi:hypothetical protein